jgi:hypothetical protein
MKQNHEGPMDTKMLFKKEPEPGDLFLLPVSDFLQTDELSHSQDIFFLVLELKNQFASGIVVSAYLPDDLIGPGDTPIRIPNHSIPFYGHLWTKGPVKKKYLINCFGSMDKKDFQTLVKQMSEFMVKGYSEKLSEMQNAFHEWIHEWIEPYRLEILYSMAVDDQSLKPATIRINKLAVREYIPLFESQEENVEPESHAFALAADSKDDSVKKQFLKIAEQKEIHYTLKPDDHNLFQFELFRTRDNRIIIRIHFKYSEVEHVKLLLENEVWFELNNAFLKNKLLECPPLPMDEVVGKNVFISIAIQENTYVQAIRFEE